jgi:hypothetical protein
MPTEPITPPATTPATEPQTAPETQPAGYFNKTQVADIQDADDILAACDEPARKAALATRDIDDAYIAGLNDAVGQARVKMAETGQANDGRQPSTINASGAERALLTVLHAVQAAAKQKRRMLDEDDDPTTNFTTEGYLIGQRLNKNRALLLQNAAAILLRAQTDALPGYGTPECVKTVGDAIEAYKEATAGQAEAGRESEADRIQRDALIRKINARCMAIRHAADAIWPYTDEASRPVRKLFKLPLSRPFNG